MMGWLRLGIPQRPSHELVAGEGVRILKGVFIPVVLEWILCELELRREAIPSPPGTTCIIITSIIIVIVARIRRIVVVETTSPRLQYKKSKRMEPNKKRSKRTQ